MTLDRWLALEEPNRVLKKRKAELAKQLAKAPGTWHAHAAHEIVAWCLHALERDEEALEVLLSLQQARGVDSGGNLVDGFGCAALAATARIRQIRGEDPTSALSELERRAGPVRELGKPQTTALRGQLKSAESVPLQGALYTIARVLSEAITLDAVFGDPAGRALVDEGLAALRGRLGVKGAAAAPAKPSDARAATLSFKPKALADAAAEARPVLGQLLARLGGQLEKEPYHKRGSTELLLATCAALLASERLDDAEAGALLASSPQVRKRPGLGLTHFSRGVALRCQILRLRGARDDALEASIHASFGPSRQDQIDGWRATLASIRESVEAIGEPSSIDQLLVLAELATDLLHAQVSGSDAADEDKQAFAALYERVRGALRALLEREAPLA